MTKAEYIAIEAFMLERMRDSAHDKHHVYRVLNAALDIAEGERALDMDVLVAAALLHDIGRDEQTADPDVNHATAGGRMAYDFLTGRGWPKDKALRVQECIAAHRYRGNRPPESAEAKILFDADKLEAIGAIGMARALIYCGLVNEALYIMDDAGEIIVDGEKPISFVQEYNYKLVKVRDSLYMQKSKQIAAKRQWAALDFYSALMEEIGHNYDHGIKRLVFDDE